MVCNINWFIFVVDIINNTQCKISKSHGKRRKINEWGGEPEGHYGNDQQNKSKHHAEQFSPAILGMADICMQPL